MRAFVPTRMAVLGVMKMEIWQAIYILIVFAGLLVGWQVDPYLAVGLIWGLIILFEVLSRLKKRAGRESYALKV